ncbi:hypothetical protein FB567DRAFT_103015 [Paraphoma chrysanthemicola]|uniref:Uncharacterized protein n=1 Tax=Paraphoma chrysanthemicola TaxID=798071 RepID=A0A8K0VW79_9PLEO|nr:hypothetical protein FB567DRAFT_103015 [Paraphoma chrysanthemicola]
MPSSAPAHVGRQYLPDELVVHILEQALVLPGGQKIDKTLHDQLFQDYLAPIITTRNRHLVDLALELYYHKNTFTVEIRARGLSRPSPAKSYAIRYLHITITECRMARELETMLLHPDSSWRWLLEPLHPLDPPRYNPIGAQLLAPSEIANSTAWQRDFRDLRTLRLETKLEKK